MLMYYYCLFTGHYSYTVAKTEDAINHSIMHY